MKFTDLDVVITLSAFPDNGIRAGQIGTVVHAFTNPNEAYLIEFANDNGETLALVTAMPSQIAIADLRKAA